MKFEHIVHIYWTKGFFFGGKQFYFNQTPNELVYELPGVGKQVKKILLNRFELTYYRRKFWHSPIMEYEKISKKSFLMPMNLIFSQINSVNNSQKDILTLKLLKLYLIKSYRGKSHFLGKPVNGQRTWSNAWNSYNCNLVLRSFVLETLSKMSEDDKPEKINFKLIKKKKKKFRKNKNKVLEKIKIKKRKWF
uniref:Ribosomal protein S13 n=1 Tax=Strombidium cf. sulcatum TaxID=2793073 RepID=A0A7T0Q549_9SPIT|nr:ribosomal protein S13 [Strombidium cf. sulcatum]QPL15950.1 ribosomal protein S13 [Strombidium cf. sulcatum]